MLSKIKKYFNTEIVKIYDNSMYHKNNNSKKHLTILIVSNAFVQKSILNRHRQVYQALSKEINNTIYALSIHTYTFHEWKKNNIINIKKNICKFM
ncbi:BolA family protein [Buchnera aphidicola]|nr:BolA family protein [Buchnera aphidicola]